MNDISKLRTVFLSPSKALSDLSDNKLRTGFQYLCENTHNAVDAKLYFLAFAEEIKRRKESKGGLWGRLFQITNKLCRTFYEAAERHRIKMGKALKKAKTVSGGKRIRLPLNYGDREWKG